VFNGFIAPRTAQEREDGLFDIEGSITDTKTYAFHNQERGTVAPGQPVHEMFVRLTVDEELVVHQAEAASRAAPFAACPEIAGTVARLRGLRITGGWAGRVKKCIGRTEGCTHITHLLLGPIAATAYQTIIPRREREKTGRDGRPKPEVVGTCHAFAEDGPVVKRLWPDFYTGT
jgi:hypothetical protein